MIVKYFDRNGDRKGRVELSDFLSPRELLRELINISQGVRFELYDAETVSKGVKYAVEEDIDFYMYLQSDYD